MSAATLQNDEGLVGHIGALWVSKRHRRQDVAHALLDAAEQWCLERDARAFVLSVAEWNTDAQATYVRRGYRVTGAVSRTRWGHLEIEMVKPPVGGVRK